MICKDWNRLCSPSQIVHPLKCLYDCVRFHFVLRLIRRAPANVSPRNIFGSCFYLLTFCSNSFNLVSVFIPAHNSTDAPVKTDFSWFYFKNASLTHCRKLSCFVAIASSWIVRRNRLVDTTFSNEFFCRFPVIS